jgi:peptidyl-tRNA hydrolase
MGTPTNPHDSPEAALARATQADPLIMYIVVRRDVPATLAGLVEAGAAVVMTCADRFERKPEFAEAFTAWRTGSFRKVVLRANAREWERLLAQEAHVVFRGYSADPFTLGDGLTAALPPMRKSAASALVRGLQVYNVGPADLAEGFCPPSETLQPSVLLAANPGVAMSAGKLMAQVGHAALMVTEAAERPGMDSPWVRAVAHWRAVGCRVAFVPASPAGWEAAVETLPCVVVRDAGLTEVEPGSRTVIALRPSDGAERDSWAHLLADGPQGH